MSCTLLLEHGRALFGDRFALLNAAFILHEFPDTVLHQIAAFAVQPPAHNDPLVYVHDGVLQVVFLCTLGRVQRTTHMHYDIVESRQY
jgi:hypothetical protein